MKHFKILSLLVITPIVYAKSAHASPHVELHMSLSPAGHFTETTDQVKGSATVTGDKVEAKNISVPLATLSDASGVKMRENHMKDKYLEVGKFPDALLTEAHGQGGKGTGKLKIRGIEKPVSGTYTLKDGGKELEATFTLKLSDYGITGVKYIGVGVKDEAEVTVVVPTTSK